MKNFVHYEQGTHPDYIAAAELAFTALDGALNQQSVFDVRPLELALPTLPTGQYDSDWITNVTLGADSNLLVITARDLGARGLNFCFGRSVYDGRTSIVSARRVSPPTFVGLVLHETGHAMGLVDSNKARYDRVSSFAGHCTNSCVMEPVNTVSEMDEAVEKIINHAAQAGFCNECIVDLANKRHA